MWGIRVRFAPRGRYSVVKHHGRNARTHWRCHPGRPIMNACPSDNEFLRFLDGQLDAEADARVVAHVQDCADCQEGLERLTRGCPSAGESQPIATVRSDPEATADLPPTADMAGDEP